MSKISVHQRMLRTGMPNTRIAPDTQAVEIEVEVDGEMKKGIKYEPCLRIFGYTREERLQPDAAEDAEPELYWEEYDLGQEPTLAAAHKAAHDWRESLRGQYPLR